MNDEMKIILAVVCIVCITILEVCAIITGFNGALFGTVLATITGIFTLAIGDKVKETIDKLRGKKDV